MTVEAAGKAAQSARLACSRPANLMEVCGTHSHAIARHGIKQMLPEGVRMLSGPGCPVCVTPTSDIDLAIEIARQPGAILATFGDMMRVPGSHSCLSEEKAKGCEVRVVYSPMDAVGLAAQQPEAQAVFVGVGFETTTPMVAASVLEAESRGLENYSVICAHKLIPPAMRALLQAEDVRIDGFLCPGHVSTIIGVRPYEEIANEYGVPCVITGFEAQDILAGLRMLMAQIDEGRACAENAYTRSVKPEGNPKARAIVDQVFEADDSVWRGIGEIPASGLRFRQQYGRFDAMKRFDIDLPPVQENPACRCGDILRGALRPQQCPLFGEGCVPSSPIGPCMVSSEGACAAVYRYEGIGVRG